MVGQPYARLYREMISEAAFNHNRQVFASPEIPIRRSPLQPHHELSPLTGPGPGYSPEESRQRIACRYQRASEWLPNTISRLQASQEFREIVQRLRGKGWKDWHILGAVLTCVVNFQVHRKYGPQAREDQFREFMETPEQPEGPEVPLTELTQRSVSILLADSIWHPS